MRTGVAMILDGMKTWPLFGHAKSSWKHPELADHGRPLNKRGKEVKWITSRQFRLVSTVYCCSLKPGWCRIDPRSMNRHPSLVNTADSSGTRFDHG
jgi:hypothetical protein